MDTQNGKTILTRIAMNSSTNLMITLLSVTSLIGSMVIASDVSTFPAFGFAVVVLSAVASSVGFAAVTKSLFLNLVKARSPVDPLTMMVAWLVSAGASSCCGLIVAVYSDPLIALPILCVTAVNIGVAVSIAVIGPIARKPW